MQLAILLVLILIALLIAPWLLGVAIAAVAIYGVFLVATAALAIVLAVLWMVFTDKSRQDRPKEIHGERKACRFCQVEMSASATRCGNCGQANT